jgi:hypothetical protein
MGTGSDRLQLVISAHKDGSSTPAENKNKAKVRRIQVYFSKSTKVISIENEVYRSMKVSEMMGYNIRPKEESKVKNSQ